MNNVSLMGRLTADPELKYTANNLAVTRFSIAVDRAFSKAGQEKQVDFINIIAWRQTAEFVCKYFHKGNRIGIVGQIRTGSYTDTDGNKRYTFEVQADNVEFCESKSGSGSSQGDSNYSNSQSSQPRQESVPSAAYSSESNDDFQQTPADGDLPF